MTSTTPRSPSSITQGYWPQHLKVGVAQIHALPGEAEALIAKNVRTMSSLVDRAAEAGAEVVVMPEYWSTGFLTGEQFREVAKPLEGSEIVRFMRSKAMKWHMYVVGGTMIEKGRQGRIYNTTLMIDPRGHICYKHRKANLYSSLGENKVFAPGDGFSVVSTAFGNVGTMICYEGDFPETPRILRLLGASMIFHVAAYESPCEKWWDTFYISNAIANGIWMVQCNLVGNFLRNTVHMFGHSRIISPTGRVVAEAGYCGRKEALKSEVVVADLPYRSDLVDARRDSDCLLRDRRPSLYGIIRRQRQP